MSEEGYFGIDWEVNERAMKLVSQARRYVVTKFESGMCVTGKVVKIWRWRSIYNYPRYCAPNETPIHMLKCRRINATNVWKLSITYLGNWLVANGKYSDPKRLILQALDKWMIGREVQSISGL